MKRLSNFPAIFSSNDISFPLGPPPGSLAAMQQAVSAAAAAAGGFGHLPNFNNQCNIGLPPTPLSALTAAARGSAAAAAAAAAAAGLTHPPTSMANHIRRRMAEKAPPLPMSNGLPYMFDRAGLDIAQGETFFHYESLIIYFRVTQNFKDQGEKLLQLPKSMS